jgi:hypothetical protein
MKDPTRFFSLVLLAALLGLFAGCGTGYEKGMKHYRPDDLAAAVRELKPLAEQGDSTAQFNLGSLYHQGMGVPQDYRQAVYWIRKAAEQGHVSAQTALGTIYAEGLQGVTEKDYPQALMWFLFASAQGDPDALEFRNTLAVKMTPGDIAQAQKLAREFKPHDAHAKVFRETQILAEKGDMNAQFDLGVIRYTGRGIPVDYAAALQWFKKAAHQGHPLAQYNAGYMYEKGEGMPQDYAEAMKYYRQSAERGNRLAQYTLGTMYERGQGVQGNEVQALKWYILAAAQGDTKARMARDRATVWMNPEQIAEAQRLAREFKAHKE